MINTCVIRMPKQGIINVLNRYKPAYIEENIKMTNQQENVLTNPAEKTKRLVTCSLFAAILALSAYFSFSLPLPGAPHITMQNFFVFLIALLFPLADSFMIVLVWMLIGAIGLPVFIGGGAGFGYLIQPWGFYTVAFLIVAAVLPLIRGKNYSRIRYTISALIGVLIIDLAGMVYLMGMNHYDLTTAISIGFLPFLPLDFLKAVAAAQLIPAFRRLQNIN